MGCCDRVCLHAGKSNEQKYVGMYDFLLHSRNSPGCRGKCPLEVTPPNRMMNIFHLLFIEGELRVTRRSRQAEQAQVRFYVEEY